MATPACTGTAKINSCGGLLHSKSEFNLTFLAFQCQGRNTTIKLLNFCCLFFFFLNISLLTLLFLADTPFSSWFQLSCHTLLELFLRSFQYLPFTSPNSVLNLLGILNYLTPVSCGWDFLPCKIPCYSNKTVVKICAFSKEPYIINHYVLLTMNLY